MASLKNKFIYQLLLSATQVLLPLLTYPYITRVLGPANLGRVNYIDFVAQLFMILAAFGIPLYAIREISMVRNDAAKRGALIKELSIIHIVLAIVFSLLFLFVVRDKLPESRMLCLLATGNILISSVSFDWYIQGMEYFKFAAIRTLVVRIAMLCCFFLLVKQSSDYPFFFGIFTAGMLIVAILNGIKIFSENKGTNQPLRFKKHLLPLFHFFLTSSAISIYEYFDTIILDRITNNEQAVGYYTMMLKMVKIILAVVIASGTVLLPRISFLVAEGNKEEVKKYLDKFLAFIIAAGIPAVTGLFIFAPEIVHTIAGEQFMPAVPLLRILCFLPLLIGPGTVFCYQVLVSFKQEKKFLTVAVAGCIISISLNFLLVPMYAASGAAYATLITEAVIAVMSGMMACKLIRLQVNPVAVIQTTGTSLIFLPVALLCRNVFASPLIIITVGALCCIILYGCIQYYVFKNSMIKEITGFIKNTLRF